MQVPLYKLVLADIINPLSDNKSEYFVSGAMLLKRSRGGGTDSSYYVEKIGKESELLKFVENFRSLEILNFRGKLVVPSFIDLHFHWVQDDVRMMPKKNLLEWLKRYTWPSEAKFKSEVYTKKKAEKFSKKLLSVGTTGGAVYCSIHPHSVTIAKNKFVGDFIFGNVLMTMNSPDYLIQTEKNAIAVINKLGAKLKQRYAVTPRFAPTTSPLVMKEGGRVARKHGTFIQTHLSETLNEIEYVLQMYRAFPGFQNLKTYTEIYDRCGLLTNRTIMGHGIHLSSEELKQLSIKGVSIAHCPTSNGPIRELGLGSGLFDFRRTARAGVEWGLASDIGGGPFLSMIDVMNSFVFQNERAVVKKASYLMALNRATRVGAKILNLKRSSGLDRLSFANFLVIDQKKNRKQNCSVDERLRAAFDTNSGKSAREKTGKLVLKTFYKGNCIFNRHKE